MSAKTPQPWLPARDYRYGEHRQWEGVRLVCCLDHTAQRMHKHPWAAGAIFPFEKAASLWAPAGPDEARRLRAVAEICSGDLHKLALAAAGPAMPPRGELAA